MCSSLQGGVLYCLYFGLREWGVGGWEGGEGTERERETKAELQRERGGRLIVNRGSGDLFDHS